MFGPPIFWLYGTFNCQVWFFHLIFDFLCFQNIFGGLDGTYNCKLRILFQPVLMIVIGHFWCLVQFFLHQTLDLDFVLISNKRILWGGKKPLKFPISQYVFILLKTINTQKLVKLQQNALFFMFTLCKVARKFYFHNSQRFGIWTICFKKSPPWILAYLD